jgi:uncharacterized protein (TIGR02145 family)
MNYCKLKFVWVFIFILSFYVVNAQKVSDILVEQQQQSIIISYHLESISPCNIDLFYSLDNEKTWLGPVKKVSGDVGEKINSGNHKINWNVLQELDQFQGENIKFKIIASGFNFETIEIGKQLWSAENLSTNKFSNGDIIPQASSISDWLYYSSLQKPAWCYYRNDKSGDYGKLYNWYAISDKRGLCPVGWHVPTNDDWSLLIEYIGGSAIAGGAMKEISTKHWNNPNEGASNTSLFTALPSGYRKEDGGFSPSGSTAAWWTANQSSKTFGSYFYLLYNVADIYKYSINKSSGLSVRCLKD